MSEYHEKIERVSSNASNSDTEGESETVLRDHSTVTTSSWKDMVDVVMDGYHKTDVDFILDIVYVSPRTTELTHSVTSSLALLEFYATFRLVKSIDSIDRYFVKTVQTVTDGKIYTCIQRALEGKRVDLVLLKYVRFDPIIFNEAMVDDDVLRMFKPIGDA